MHLRKSLFGILGIFVLMCGVTISLKASYYKPDFFPISLTGLNYTGSGTPYGNVKDESNRQMWFWDDNPYYSDQTEKALIDSLGVNCLGCEDCYPPYLIDLGDSEASNYLTKVCEPLGDVYLITASYYAERYWYEYYYTGDTIDSCPAEDNCDGVEDYPKDEDKYGDTLWLRSSQFFRSPYRKTQAGWGSARFTPSDNSNPSDYGSDYDNWNCFDGDSLWRAMADSSIERFEDYFTDSEVSSNDYLDYIWGYNLITEDDVARHYPNNGANDVWHGNWAAADRIFRGKNTDQRFKDSIPDYETKHKPVHSGMRGLEDSLSVFNNKHRMIVAKSTTLGLRRMGYDIFDYLPDIDIFVCYNEGWCKAHLNYGSQGIFDTLLYGTNDMTEKYWGGGYHNDAVYMQTYGKTGRDGSEPPRRWIAGLTLKWAGVNPAGTKAKVRRPCPPEIRCAVYLCLSRGAKGILFHEWSREPNGSPPMYPKVNIPFTNPDSTCKLKVCLRDDLGYPYGDAIHFAYDTNHVLNDGVGNGDSTYWHHPDNRKDLTYSYLANSLIPEIKDIDDILVKLDWVNAYSLKSTATGKASPCPHMYVQWVLTNREGYIDLAFFDDPDDAGSEYFMVVNRDDIDSMQNASIEIKLNGSGWFSINKLIVKNMADTTDTFVLLNSTGYIFTDTFEPGEGKLYRVEI